MYRISLVRYPISNRRLGREHRDAVRFSIEAGFKPVASLEEKSVSCPYCGEFIEVLIDQEEAGQTYIEDCQVCCRPISFRVDVDAGGYLSVSVRDENEAF